MYNNSLAQLYNLLAPNTKRAIFILLFSLLIIGLFELLTIIFLVPLLSMGTYNFSGEDVSSLNQGGLTSYAINFISVFFQIKTFFDYSIFLLLFMLGKHIVLLSCNYFQYRIIFANDVWLRDRLLKKYLSYSYLKYIKVNSSDLIKNTAEQVGQISYGALLSILNIVSEFLIILFLATFLFSLLNFKFVLLIVAVFVGAFFIYWLSFKGLIIKLGKRRYNSIDKIILEIQNIHNLFTEIKLYELESYFLKRLKSYSKEFSNSQTKYTFVSFIPKSIIELLMVLIIVFLVYTLQDSRSYSSEIILIIATILRLSPSYTRISSSLGQFKYSLAQIETLNEILSANAENHLNGLKTEKFKFSNKIEVVKLNFSYESNKICLKEISFDIKKGQFIIIKGPSGTGKSTLIKLLMGLVKPNSGELFLDGIDINNLNIIEWHRAISYVPQNPIIIEGTIVENIILGSTLDTIDFDILNRVISCSNISDLYLDLKESTLSENGKSLSGGQAQRIAIARALYRNPEIIFMDEPTSSLDSANSRLFISTIHEYAKDKNLTIVIITHSNEYDAFADRIVCIDNEKK